MSIDIYTEGICPQCKRPKVVALHGGLCHEHFKVVSKAKKVPDPIKQASDKQSVLNRAYSTIAKAYKSTHPICQAALIGCTKITEDVHHMGGRGVNLLNEDKFLAVCRHCHTILEENPTMAKALGLSISRLSKTENES